MTVAPFLSRSLNALSENRNGSNQKNLKKDRFHTLSLPSYNCLILNSLETYSPEEKDSSLLLVRFSSCIARTRICC